jgi:LysM repeat protein
MTERSVPIVGGASVCPFVAFEDDRDERASRPDHRHRCFAEVRPASRALAHQEAYCLSPTFPACPTFQDWARREAARARAAPASVRAPEPIDEPVARPPRRDWSAPPPWIDEAAGAPRPTVPEGAGLAEAPLFLAERDRPPATVVPPASAVRPTSGTGHSSGTGLAVAAGLAAADSSTFVVDDDRSYDDEDAATWESPADAPADRSGGSGGSSASRPPSGRRPSVSDSRRATRTLGGPSWERPQRHEAYPTLKTRIGLPGVPRVAVAFAGLVVAALILFLVPPMLLRPGGGVDTGGGATPVSSAEPTASLAPTPIPSPTPQVYVIVAGDTLSGVAKTHGLTLEELLAANPSITDPDKIAIGDEIIIPAPVPSELVDLGGAGASEAPSVAP